MNRVIGFKDIAVLRKVAESLKGDLPHLPLLLELCISGLSRHSISKLKIEDIKNNETVIWKKRNNSIVSKRLSENQKTVLDEYLYWRRKRYTEKRFLILVKYI